MRRIILAFALVASSLGFAAVQAWGDSSQPPFILVLGGSTAVGMQPIGIKGNLADPTHDSFQEMMAATAPVGFPDFDIHTLACSGATAQGMYQPNQRLTSDTCYPKTSSQLAAAVSFLNANTSRQGIVVIDLGQNLLHKCMRTVPTSDACLNSALVDVSTYLPRVARDIVAASGPQVDVVGLNYFDPFVARPLTSSPTTWSQARHLHSYFVRANQLVAAAYGAAKIPVADLASAFGSNNWSRVNFSKSRIPSNAFHACQLTWICYAPPFGPDPHPTRAGYIVIADAVWQTLPAPWNQHPLGWTSPLAMP